MDIEKQIKKLKDEEKEGPPVESMKQNCQQDNSWIFPAIIVFCLFSYFTTGEVFGSLWGYWWLIFFVPMFAGWFNHQPKKGI